MSAEPLRVTQVAKLFDVPTRRIIDLIAERRVPHVMVEGIAHVPVEALDDYRAAVA